MIKIIAVGKNNHALKDYERNFIDRIKKFAKFELIELKEDKSKNQAQIKQKEDAKILEKIKADELVYALDVSGESLNSIQFSEILRNPDITFVIGGAYGFGEKVRNRADKNISLSAMTFNHQLARIMLLEQIYRGLSIIKNKNYHK